MVTVYTPGSDGKHIGIELFSDQTPDLGAVIQLVGAMPGARFEHTGDRHLLMFRSPETGWSYGNFHLSLTDAPGLDELGASIAPHAVAKVLEELQARMCPRQVAYIAVDGAYSPKLIQYLSREIPRLMETLGQHAAAVIVPCIGLRELAHHIADHTIFGSKLEEAVKIVNVA